LRLQKIHLEIQSTDCIFSRNWRTIDMHDLATRGGSLTEEQVEFYDREGYLLLPDLLNEDDLAPGVEALQQKVDLIADEMLKAGEITDTLAHRPFRYRLAELFAGRTDADFLRYGRSWRDRFVGYYHLMCNPKILDAVESLIGGEIFSNPIYNSRPKVPGVAAGAVPWHQDKSYWPDANSNPVITVWIPLVDSNAENGCLHVWPRTHKKQLLEHGHEKVTGTSYLEVKEEFLVNAKREAVALPMAAGSALLFNDRCVHMSTPNKSDHVRWSVDLRYQPTDQDRMVQHGAGFLARSRMHPQRVATAEDWLANRLEHQTD
jgi:phytanoyl-CoA hydroxylase